MSGEGITVNLKEEWRLYKWDAAIVGDDPPDPTQIDATAHPACVEIWEMSPDAPAKLVYRRD